MQIKPEQLKKRGPGTRKNIKDSVSEYTPALVNSSLLLTSEESRQVDVLWSDQGGDIELLIKAAGRAAAECLDGYLRGIEGAKDTKGEIIILCGKGQNGADGFAAAHYLNEWGYDVRVVCVGLSPEAQKPFNFFAYLWQGPVYSFDPAFFDKPLAIVDAVIGTGFSPRAQKTGISPLDRNSNPGRSRKSGLAQPLIDIIALANKSSGFRFALDLPTGLCADTGQALADVFKADATLAFVRRKPAHVMVPGRYLCGGSDHIHVADLDIPSSILASLNPQFFENTPLLWGHDYPVTGPATHKYDRGHVLILGGSEPGLGASRLAALSCLRVGAGLATLATPPETYAIQAAALTDVMVRQCPTESDFVKMLDDTRISSIVIGPGCRVGPKMATLVADILQKMNDLENTVSIVLDAGALASIAPCISDISKESDILKGYGLNAVITPHDGEFKKLFPALVPVLDIQKDRIKAAQIAAKEIGMTVVLKGVSTVIASPCGRVALNSNAPSWLSIGGTGDVLSGVIAGLLAQGMNAFDAASAGVWLHSAAALKCGKGMLASDLPYAFKRVILT